MPGYYTPAQAQAFLYELIDAAIDSEDPEPDYAYNDIFQVDDMTRGQYVNYRTGGLEKPQARQLLEDLAQVNYTEGELQTITPTSYGCQFGVPMELLKDIQDMGPTEGANLARIGTFADFTRRTKRNFYWRADIEAARKFLNGTSTAAPYVGRDGKAWFSATQTTLANPAITQSNVTTGASFTAANVMTAISSLRTQRDDNGAWMKRPTKIKVITSEANAWKADEIFDSEKQVDTGNNTINPLYKWRGKIQHIVWNELDPTYTGWFVMADSASARFKWRDRPDFTKDVDNSARAVKYYAAARFALFHEHWLGVVGFPTS